MLLADISAARGHPVQSSSSSPLSHTKTLPGSAPHTYPFHLLLTSATIPLSLAAYLDAHHPGMTRLASPGLHHLPRTLQTEYVAWSGGRRWSDVERRVRRVWAEDAAGGGAEPSKILVFCNKSTKVEELGAYLAEKGTRNVALTSTSEARRRGSNRHLDGFLRTPRADRGEVQGVGVGVDAGKRGISPASTSTEDDEPRVLITTSLLSRGLDFVPAIRHVFIVDEPRNMVDFLHRAGRSGRAGERGRVVVFGKTKGRGSEKAKEVRRKVGALAA